MQFIAWVLSAQFHNNKIEKTSNLCTYFKKCVCFAQSVSFIEFWSIWNLRHDPYRCVHLCHKNKPENFFSLLAIFRALQSFREHLRKIGVKFRLFEPEKCFMIQKLTNFLVFFRIILWKKMSRISDSKIIYFATKQNLFLVTKKFWFTFSLYVYMRYENVIHFFEINWF